MTFRHEALLFDGREAFLRGTVPYIETGLAAGEPVLVALPPQHLSWLRQRFGEAIEYADIDELGRNPARIIPAWQAFLDRHEGPARDPRLNARIAAYLACIAGFVNSFQKRWWRRRSTCGRNGTLHERTRPV